MGQVPMNRLSGAQLPAAQLPAAQLPAAKEPVSPSTDGRTCQTASSPAQQMAELKAKTERQLADAAADVARARDDARVAREEAEAEAALQLAAFAG